MLSVTKNHTSDISDSRAVNKHVACNLGAVKFRSLSVYLQNLADLGNKYVRGGNTHKFG